MNNAFALPVIHSGNGSLEQYIHTVNSIPMLTPEEESQLAERQQKGDLNAAKQLILSHLRVVVSIARGYDAMAEPSRPYPRRQHRTDESGQTLRAQPWRALVFIRRTLD